MFADYMRQRLGLNASPTYEPPVVTPTPWMHQGPNQIQQPAVQPTPWMHQGGPQMVDTIPSPTAFSPAPINKNIEQWTPRPQPTPATDSYKTGFEPEGRVPRQRYNPYTF